MALTLEQVRHVAALAKLGLSPDEERALALDLSRILAAFEKLGELPLDQVEPTLHCFSEGGLRDDVVRPSLPPEQGLANAPQVLGTSFGVPKVID